MEKSPLTAVIATVITIVIAIGIAIVIAIVIAPKASAEGACIFSKLGYYGACMMGYYGAYQWLL